MTPCESFSFRKNGSSILLQLMLITFFIQKLCIYIYIYIYICIYIYTYISYTYCPRPYCLELRQLCCCYCDIVLIAVFVVVSGNVVAFVIGIVFAAVVGVAIWIVGSVFVLFFLFLVFSLCHGYCKTSLCIRLICSL